MAIYKNFLKSKHSTVLNFILNIKQGSMFSINAKD